MSSLPEKIARIRREIDPADPQTLSYYGVSAQRRLSKLAMQIAGEDTQAIIQETDDSLGEAITLLTHKPMRWLDPLLRLIAILPIKTPEERYKDLQRKLQEHLTKLQQQRLQFKVWRSDGEDILRDLKLHVSAAQIALQEVPSGHDDFLDNLRLRLQDISASQQIAGLVLASLNERQSNYRLLIEQLQVLLGNSSAAWHIFRAQLRTAGPGGFARMRELAEGCRELTAPWQGIATETDSPRG